MEDRLPRKLAAILYADVAGYSRLTGENEDATHRRLSQYLDLVSMTVDHHHGRVLHYAGDAVLAMFDAAADALSCAVQIQRDLTHRNQDLDDAHKVEFRIGVNVGDVIEDRGDIYGDGVNVAARLESLAEPGGICVSESVYTMVGNTLPLEYEYRGEQKVKNIAQAVRAYYVLSVAPRSPEIIEPPQKTGRSASRLAMYGAIMVFLVAGVGVWAWLRLPDLLSTNEKAVPLPQTEKPSIAVLPFANMSTDLSQEYFSDGMTDDLITDLSKVSGLFVIARNSVFTYKGKNTKVQEIAKDLGVRYVLEGSVRRVGDNVRINAQLIDATDGGHLWAERYDGKIDDVFQLQDKVTRSIVTALKIELTPQEEMASERPETDNIAAYDQFLRGWEYLLRRNPEDAVRAIEFFNRALALDPDYSRAYSTLAQAYWDNSSDRKFTVLLGMDTGQDDSGFALDIIAWNYLQKAQGTASAQTHALRSRMLQRQRLFNEALIEAERGVAAGPNDPAAYDALIEHLIYAGKPHNAIELTDRSMQLDPSLLVHKLFLKGMAHYAIGNLDSAISFIDRARSHNPNQSRYLALQAATLAELGRIDEAKQALRSYLSVTHSYTTLNWTMFYWPFQERQTAERMAANLLKAGLRRSPAPYYFVSEKDRLDNVKIEALISNKAMIALDRGASGFESEMEIWRDKSAQIIHQEFITYFRDGQSRIENDLLCDPWWDFGDYCIAIYRNPGGTDGSKDEYIFFTISGIFTFSVFDIPS